MPFQSKAQQGYMHAAAARGEIPKKVVREFDKATTSKQYARLPEHVKEHDARGGLAGRLAQRYFRGGKAPEREPAEEPGGVCQHFAHGGAAEDHSPNCYDHPDHPMYRGGEADAEDPEEVDQSGEGNVHIDVYSHGAEEYAEGGDVEPPGVVESVRRWLHTKGGSKEEQEAGRNVDESANAALPEWLSGRGAVLKKREQLRQLDEQTRGYAQGGEAEETEQHLDGADWQDDERSRKRAPLAERLSGARLKPGALTRLLRKPGTRVP